MSSQTSEVVSEAPQSKDDQLSLKQPVWQVIVLSILTFKMYFIYWCYKTWRDFSKHIDETNHNATSHQEANASRHSDAGAGQNKVSATEPGHIKDLSWTANAEELLHSPDSAILKEDKTPAQVEHSPSLLESLSPKHLSSFRHASPMLRAIFAAVPYIQHYMLYTIALGTANLQPKGSSVVASHPVLCAVAVTAAWITLSCLSMLPEPLYLTSFLCLIPLAIIQHWINRYWDSVETPGLIMRHGFTFKELITIIVGALLLGFLGSSLIIKAGK